LPIVFGNSGKFVTIRNKSWRGPRPVTKSLQ
jgi:hypothetical protein